MAELIRIRYLISPTVAPTCNSSNVDFLHCLELIKSIPMRSLIKTQVGKIHEGAFLLKLYRIIKM